MEWVETTGHTVEEARERALDELGVDEADAEIEVVEEAQTGLFGRVRREARVRARVRPVQPRPKNERRDRRRRKGSSADGGAAPTAPPAEGGATAPDTEAAPAAGTETAPRSRSRRGRGSGGSRNGRGKGARTPASEAPLPDEAGRPVDDAPTGDAPSSPTPRGEHMTTPLTLDEQADRMTDFLEGLLDAFGYEGTVEREQVNDETIELAIEGDDLGLLIGPKGQTLTAIQELARVASTRDAGFPTDGRVRLDVSGYRQRRRDALERFAQKVAAEVRETGRQKVLEPMSPPDRKVVHDTVNEIDGVRTFSEGEDSARRVVIAPE